MNVGVERPFVLIVVLLAVTLSAGCFGPSEDPATTETETGTTPGETVEAGGQPTEVPESPTMFGTTTESETNATGAVDGTQETTTANETAEQ